MKQRIITASILLAVFLALILINARWLNFAVFALILVLAFFESLKLWGLEETSKKRDRQRKPLFASFFQTP